MGALEEKGLPVFDLIGVDVVLMCNLSECLFSLDIFTHYDRLEIAGISFSFLHRFYSLSSDCPV
jgi:hypothetical protein